jgi:hypothetical protein
LSTGDDLSLEKNFNNVLERDLMTLRLVEVNPFITKVIKAINDKYKAIFETKKTTPMPTEHQKAKTVPSEPESLKAATAIIKYSAWE